MGVTNLLPVLAPITKNMHLRDFSGMRVAIDAFVWLHKAAYSCTEELFKNPSTKRILPFIMKRLRAVIEAGMKPIFIIDGRNLPSKSLTDAKRHQIRKNALDQINIAQMNHRSPDSSLYSQAVSISFATVQTLITELENQHIPFIVAPYEADAQLAFMSRNNLVDCVITEDCDMIPYQCPITLFKLNDEGNVQVIYFQDVLPFLQLDYDQFLATCVLAGCDYAPHVKQMGFKTAIKMVKQYKTGEETIRVAKGITKFGFPENYERYFKNACMTYKYQQIFDPRTKTMHPLTPYHQNPPDFLGPMIPQNELLAQVSGKLNPFHGSSSSSPEPAPVQAPAYNQALPQTAQPQVQNSNPNMRPHPFRQDDQLVPTEINNALLNIPPHPRIPAHLNNLGVNPTQPTYMSNVLTGS